MVNERLSRFVCRVCILFCAWRSVRAAGAVAGDDAHLQCCTGCTVAEWAHYCGPRAYYLRQTSLYSRRYTLVLARCLQRMLAYVHLYAQCRVSVVLLCAASELRTVHSYRLLYSCADRYGA